MSYKTFQCSLLSAGDPINPREIQDVDEFAAAETYVATTFPFEHYRMDLESVDVVVNGRAFNVEIDYYPTFTAFERKDKLPK